ncbi:MFS transporter [Paenibacillus glycanilyticus]|uniref:MFS transporter n=1 Tax=Paenibacillus glycanilyticus TaxID=126569 RepID=UPI003EBB31EA
MAIPLAALCSTSWAIGKWIGQNKKLMKWISVIGFIEAAGSLIFLAFGGRDFIWFIIILLFVGSIGLGAALPSLDALLTEGIEKDQRGTITSIYSSIRFLGVAAGPPLAALLIAHSKSSLFWLLTACCVAAALIALFTIKPKQA